MKYRRTILEFFSEHFGEKIEIVNPTYGKSFINIVTDLIITRSLLQSIHFNRLLKSLGVRLNFHLRLVNK